MASIITLTTGTLDTVLSTELNSMANNALVLGSEITLTNQNYYEAEVELYIASFASAPTANTAFRLWLLRALDGTNYEDGGTSVTPLRNANQFFTLRAVSTAQRIVKRCRLPPGKFKPLLLSDGIGVAIASASNTLKIKPLSPTF